jgi:RNA polymerase sigma factor (sigma-70 family)
VIPETRPLTGEQQDLAATCYRLARWLAWKYCREHPSCRGLAEELRGAAMIGLMMAAQTFDPAAGSKFSSWAATVVAGRIKREATHQRRQKRDRRRETEIPGWLEIGPADQNPPPDLPGDFLSLVPEPLTPYEAAGIGWCVLGRLEIAEAARRLGVSRQTVYNDRCRALAKLRRYPPIAAYAP